jgi:hypothetical protein
MNCQHEAVDPNWFDVKEITSSAFIISGECSDCGEDMVVKLVCEDFVELDTVKEKGLGNTLFEKEVKAIERFS